MSTGGTLLSVSGLALDTVINAEGNTDVTVAYRGDLSGSANAVSVTLDRFGTGTGTTTTDAGVLTIGTGIETLSVAASGTAYLTVEAGDTLRTITVSATEAMTFVTDELLTSFNAAGLTKTSDFTFNGTSDLAFVGGAGNDTVRLGGTHSNGDSVDGGSGTDAIRLSMAADRSLQATNVERLFVNLTNSTADLTLTSAQSITEITVSGAGVGGNIINFAGGTVNLVDDGVSSISLDTVSGASVTLVVGGTAQVDIASARVVDASAVTISNVSASAGTINDFANLTLATTVKTLNVTAAGSAGLNLAAIAASGLESLNVVALGSAAATVDVTIGSSAIETITVNAIGSSGSDVTLIGNFAPAGTKELAALSLQASAGASVTAADFNLGSAATGESVSVALNIEAGANSDVVVGGVTGAGLNSVTIGIVAGESASADLGALVFNTGVESNISLNISAAVATGSEVGIVSLDTDGDLNLVVDAITVNDNGVLKLFTGDADFSTASIGVITLKEGASAEIGSLSGLDIGTVAFVVGTNANLDVDSIEVSSIDGISVTVGLDGSAQLANISGGADDAMGDSTFTLSQGADLNVADMDASSLGVLTITVGTAASANFSDFLATGGAVSGLNIVVRSGGTFSADTLQVSGGVLATANIGVTTAATAEFNSITAGTMSKMSITGAGVVNLQSVYVSGGASFDLAGMAGTFSADLRTMSAALTLTGGPGTTMVVVPNESGGSVNNIRLATATGTDTLRYVTAITGAGNEDQVVNFELGSGGDVLSLNSGFASNLNLVNATGTVIGTGAAVNADLSVAIASASTLDASDNVIVFGTAFANTAAMLNFLKTSVTFATAAVPVAGDLIVIFTTDNATSSSMVAVVNFSASGDNNTLATGTATIVQTLANFTGQTAGAWTAANISLGGG
jgi:hypothetical protein